MKWQRFFLLLFLIPTLIYGFDLEKCTRIHNQVAPEWNRHNELIEQSKQLAPHELIHKVHRLRESVECCKRAIAHCDTILHDIASQSKSKRKEPWRIQFKALCEQERNTIQAEIHAIQPIIEQIQSLLAFDQAHILYQKSVEKATQAASKDRACQRRLTNVDEVVRVLNETAKLYDEATSMALEALAGIAPYSSQETNQDALKQVIETYRGFAEKYKKEAADWPTSISAQKKTLQSQVETLKKDSTIFTEKGLKRSCYELQKQAVLLLETLIEGSTGEEAEAWKEERALLQGAIAAFEKEADRSRLTRSGSSLSPEEFKAQEKERKELFFKSDLFLHPEVFLSESAITNAPFPRVVPLDGQLSKKKGEFVLYTGQFYRFLVQNDSAVPELFIKVYDN